jgi:hypothetical protein
MGFNSAFKGLIDSFYNSSSEVNNELS